MSTKARVLCLLVASGALVGLAALTESVAARGGTPPACPSFSSSAFHHSSRVDNSYFPLTPGDLYTYDGHRKRAPVHDEVYVTHNTPTIAGVKTVEVRDRGWESGVLIEDTLDWYAQDDSGNVWYFGEFTTQLPAGTHDGSWTAGVDGAQPGYIMEGPARAVGDTYCQENAPGIAEDVGQIVSLTASRSVPYGTFAGNLVQTKDYSLIEPHSESKYYAPGIGMLEAIALNGGSEDLQLSTLQHNQ